MIDLPGKKTEFAIDVGRPTIFEEHSRELWRKFHDLVKQSQIKITINSMFPYIQSVIDCDETCSGDRFYGGGSYKYMFWFESAEDKKKFISEIYAHNADWEIIKIV